MKIWSTGREESQKEESHTGGSGAGQPVDQGEEGTSQTPDVFQSERLLLYSHISERRSSGGHEASGKRF